MVLQQDSTGKATILCIKFLQRKMISYGGSFMAFSKFFLTTLLLEQMVTAGN